MGKVKPIELRIEEGIPDSGLEIEAVLSDLKKKKLYHENLFFNGFDGNFVHVVLEHGVRYPEFDSVLAGNEDEFRDISDPNCALSYAYYHDKPAIAVYDGRQLIPHLDGERKVFKNPKRKLDALIAVYLLR